MLNPIKISAVIITHNEEAKIGRCIKSLKDIADEIIVIDSFSSDNTTSIASALGALCHQHPWMGYSEQKNLGISLAHYDWIFSLDADEAVSDILKGHILALKNNPLHDGFIMNRLTNYCGKWIRHGDWYPDQKLRLWDKRLGQWQGEIHEEVKLKQGSVIGKLNGDILHYSYDSILDHVQQMRNFTELMAKDNIRKGRRPSLFKIIFSPVFKFIKSYFFRLGFLDGYEGWVISKMSAHATFLKYSRTRELLSK